MAGPVAEIARTIGAVCGIGVAIVFFLANPYHAPEAVLHSVAVIVAVVCVAILLYDHKPWKRLFSMFGRATHDTTHERIKKGLSDLAQQATEIATKIKTSAKPIETKSSIAWRTPTVEVLAIRDQARMAITAVLGKEQGELFSSQRFGSALPHGYAENLAPYLFGLVEGL